MGTLYKIISTFTVYILLVGVLSFTHGYFHKVKAVDSLIGTVVAQTVEDVVPTPPEDTPAPTEEPQPEATPTPESTPEPTPIVEPTTIIIPTATPIVIFS